MKTGEFECQYAKAVEAIEKDRKEHTSESAANRDLDVLFAADALIDSMFKDLPTELKQQYNNEATDVMSWLILVRDRLWKELGWD